MTHFGLRTGGPGTPLAGPPQTPAQGVPGRGAKKCTFLRVFNNSPSRDRSLPFFGSGQDPHPGTGPRPWGGTPRPPENRIPPGAASPLGFPGGSPIAPSQTGGCISARVPLRVTVAPSQDRRTTVPDWGRDYTPLEDGTSVGDAAPEGRGTEHPIRHNHRFTNVAACAAPARQGERQPNPLARGTLSAECVLPGPRGRRSDND